MKIVFCIFKYFPFGGLQRDFLRIALECQRRGHKITIFTTSWVGEIPAGFDIRLLKCKALSNHAKMKEYSSMIEKKTKTENFSAVVGFNRIQSLDVYFAGDNCLFEKAIKERNFLYRFTPRFRTFAVLEKAVFNPSSKAEILYLTARQKREYIKHYSTQEKRFHLMPPGISIERKRPADWIQIRRDTRDSLNLSEKEIILIQVGSGFITKGLDRSIAALASLSKDVRDRTIFLVIGSDNQSKFIKLSKKLEVETNVRFLGGSNDVTNLLVSSDLMIHPAINEATGTVLLEALAAGLPVICSEACGYACYVEKAKAGVVTPEPFNQEYLNQKLYEVLAEKKLEIMSKNALNFAQTEDIYNRQNFAADVIEKIAKAKPLVNEIAFCLFNYFQFGGLERDCLQIAIECQRRGYGIRFYTFSWDGSVPDGFNIRFIPKKKFTNYSNAKFFSHWVKQDIKSNPVVAVVGANRIEGLDVYFAGDNCIMEKGFAQENLLYRLTPRFKVFTQLEKAVFDSSLKTIILYLTERQKNEYQKHYQTQDERFHLMPAGISVDRKRPANAEEIRNETRKNFGFSNSDKVLIEIGSGYFRKGVDRVITAVASLPDDIRSKTFYLVVGKETKTDYCIKLVKQLNIEKQIIFLGERKDVPQLMLASELMVHPAVDEAAGNVLLEAIAIGLPVICSGTCGFAFYIERARAGVVIPEPYKQENLNKELRQILSGKDLPQMSRNALIYAENNSEELFTRPQRAADVIEETIREKQVSKKLKNKLSN